MKKVDVLSKHHWIILESTMCSLKGQGVSDITALGLAPGRLVQAAFLATEGCRIRWPRYLSKLLFSLVKMLLVVHSLMTVTLTTQKFPRVVPSIDFFFCYFYI